MLDTSKDKLLFASAISISSQMTAFQHLLLKQPQIMSTGRHRKLTYSQNLNPLSLTPNRLNTTLEADFTQFNMSISNEIQQLMDKRVHSDNNLKLHKQISDGISSDLSLHIDNVNGEFMKQAKQLNYKMTTRPSTKKYSLIFEAHTNLRAQYKQLQEEVTFLKDQIKALWQKPAGDTNVTQMPLSSTKEPTQKPPTSSADDEDAQPSSPKTDDQQQIVL